MKHQLCIPLAGILVLGLLTLSRGQDSDSRAWVSKKIDAKNTRHEIFKSETIGQNTSYIIYLPEAYEVAPNTRYPVIYWLHGMGEGLGLIQRMAGHFDAAIESARMPPVLVVFVNGMWDSLYLDSADGKKPVETVIIQDLIPHIDSNYRTLANRDGRIIEGFSMGGYGAAHLGFKYPELFGTVSVIDGALPNVTYLQDKNPGLYQRIFGGNAERVTAEDPRTLAKKNAAEIRGKMTIRIASGRLGPTNRLLHEHLASIDITHDHDAFGGEHNAFAIFDSLGEKNWEFYREAVTNAGQ